ncbi:amino acid permease [Shigella flexneri]
MVGVIGLLWIVSSRAARCANRSQYSPGRDAGEITAAGSFIVLALMLFKLDTYSRLHRRCTWRSCWEQVKQAMLITLWVFIGVGRCRGLSARARDERDVGKATLLAVSPALGVYLLVTLLSLGVVARPELAEIRNPSMAGLMVEMMGPSGQIIIAELIVSVCGAYLSWTIMAAEVHFLAPTGQRAFPRPYTPKRTSCAIRLTVVAQHLRANLSGTHLAGRVPSTTRC